MPTQKTPPSKVAAPKLKVKKEKEPKKKKAVALTGKEAKSPKAIAAAAARVVAANQASTEVAKEKLKKLGKGATEASGDDVDPEEQADELAAAVEVDPDAVEEEVEEEAIGERKEVKDLLEAGKQKGFLTYDEGNDALPADIVSSDQIDDVMSMFGDNEIEIVDAQKAAQGTEVKPTVAATDENQKEEAEEEKEEEDEPGGKSNDPVRLYLRKMGSVS